MNALFGATLRSGETILKSLFGPLLPRRKAPSRGTIHNPNIAQSQEPVLRSGQTRSNSGYSRDGYLGYVVLWIQNKILRMFALHESKLSLDLRDIALFHPYEEPAGERASQ